MDLNLTDSSLKKKYIYADRQILAQHDIDDDAQPAQDDKYFYLHDRLGSVRLVIDDSATPAVVKYYTYEPFGEVIDQDGTFTNAFMFTGQFFDSEIEEYYLRARQYNPQIARFTSRDPVLGDQEESLTLHKYLYSLNDPINGVDPTGEYTEGIEAASQLHNVAVDIGAHGVESGDLEYLDLAVSFENERAFAAGLPFNYWVNPIGQERLFEIVIAWLGPGAYMSDCGVYVSKNMRRVFRMRPSDLRGHGLGGEPQTHFEFWERNEVTGEKQKIINWHVPYNGK